MSQEIFYHCMRCKETTSHAVTQREANMKTSTNVGGYDIVAECKCNKCGLTRDQEDVERDHEKVNAMVAAIHNLDPQ